MRLSIIIPCYNEQARGVDKRSFESRLDLLLKYTSKMKDIEVILVDDGSTDDSVDVFTNYVISHDLDNWSFLELGKNLGKGGALLEGFKLAKGDYICFLDADMSVSPKYILDAYRDIIYYERHNKEVCIIGTRYSPNSQIRNRRTLVRRAVSKSSRLLLNALFGLNVSDVQCGFKVFPSKALKNCLNLVYESRWLLDVELLYAMRVQEVPIKEMSVIWKNLEHESTVKVGRAVKNSLIDLYEIIKIKKYLKLLL